MLDFYFSIGLSIGHRSRERARTDAQAAMMNEFPLPPL
jgi:hypothetical protein